RSVSRFEWLQDDIGVSGIQFEVEDKAHIRQCVGFMRGIGMVLALTGGNSDHDVVSSKGFKTRVFVRSSFGVPGTLQVIRSNDEGRDYKYKQEGQHVALDPPMAVKQIDHFNDTLRSEWNLGEVKNVTYK